MILNEKSFCKICIKFLLMPKFFMYVPILNRCRANCPEEPVYVKVYRVAFLKIQCERFSLAHARPKIANPVKALAETFRDKYEFSKRAQLLLSLRENLRKLTYATISPTPLYVLSIEPIARFLRTSLVFSARCFHDIFFFLGIQ